MWVTVPLPKRPSRLNGLSHQIRLLSGKARGLSLTNGRSLIELIREIELPFAIEEGRSSEAGNYVWLRLKWLPDVWQYFHGVSYDAEIYPYKTHLLECGTCGVPGCWPLLTRIEVKDKSIIWRLFEQPYRRKKYETRHTKYLKFLRTKHWKYDGIGPFRFDREQYESALKPLGAEPLTVSIMWESKSETV